MNKYEEVWGSAESTEHMKIMNNEKYGQVLNCFKTGMKKYEHVWESIKSMKKYEQAWTRMKSIEKYAQIGKHDQVLESMNKYEKYEETCTLYWNV